jgi:NADH:ubiquinone oxidoreductase subunit 6 (subunit J)
MNGNVFFYFFLITTALSGFSILLVKNVLHGVLLLLMCLLSIAALYVLLAAEFLAVAQILIYAGGVVVLIIFGIMFSSRIASKPLKIGSKNNLPGFLSAAALLIILIYCFQDIRIETSFHAPSIQRIGVDLMTGYAAPFELAGILLLLTLVGASVTASVMNRKS